MHGRGDEQSRYRTGIPGIRSRQGITRTVAYERRDHQIFGGGTAVSRNATSNTSPIINTLNERFGLTLDERDRLLFEQFEQTWLAEEDVVARAQHNTLENFRLVFDREFMRTVVNRMDMNEAIFKRILDDEEFRRTLMEMYATRVYRRARTKDDPVETADE